MSKSHELLLGFFVVPNNKNFAISAALVIFLCPQAQSLALETVPFPFWPELEPQLYGQVLNLGKPQKLGVSIAVLMSSSIAFFTTEYTLFFTNSFFPFLCNRQLLETSFYLAQTYFSSLCFCYEFNTTNRIVNFLQHCWSCTKCTECTNVGIYYFFLVERRV